MTDGGVKPRFLWLLKNTLNRATIRVARSGHGPFSLIRHVGRKTGKEYQTPVMLAPVGDGFIAELTYGPEVQWYRNIVAAGGCVVVHHGVEYTVDRIEPCTAEAGLQAFGYPRAFVLKLLRRRDFRLLHNSTASATTAERRGGPMSRPYLFTAEVHIARPAQDVFDVYVDVENWPSWTASMSEVHRLDAGAVRVGARTRVRQPRLPAVEWTVTELVPGESFSWESRRAGLITVARHRIRSEAGGCVVTAELEHQGLLAPLIAAVSAPITRRYLQMETDGLKARCERERA